MEKQCESRKQEADAAEVAGLDQCKTMVARYNNEWEFPIVGVKRFESV